MPHKCYTFWGVRVGLRCFFSFVPHNMHSRAMGPTAINRQHLIANRNGLWSTTSALPALMHVQICNENMHPQTSSLYTDWLSHALIFNLPNLASLLATVFTFPAILYWRWAPLTTFQGDVIRLSPASPMSSSSASLPSARCKIRLSHEVRCELANVRSSLVSCFHTTRHLTQTLHSKKCLLPVISVVLQWDKTYRWKVHNADGLNIITVAYTLQTRKRTLQMVSATSQRQTTCTPTRAHYRWL